MRSESGKSEPAVAVFAKARSGSSHYLNLIEQVIEKFPASHALRAFQPDVGGIYTACVLYSQFVTSRGDFTRVLTIIIYGFMSLLLTLLRKYRLRAALHRIRNPVEFASLPPVPQVGELYFIPCAGFLHQLVGDYGIAAAGSRETCRL